MKRTLQNTYALADCSEANPALEKTAPRHESESSAARSLELALEETLAVHKLRTPDSITLVQHKVRRSVETACSIVETVCRNVKPWRPGDQIECPAGSGLLVAERQFRRQSVIVR